MKNEIKIFFTALMFYTRIPCPTWVDHSEDYLNKATRYFPLIGYIVGGISFIVYFFSSYIFSSEIAVLFSIITGILIRGAFHEDGFADVCDGFGGGWTKQKILEIMKDSRIGAYGTIGTILLLSLKFYSLLMLVQTFENNYLLIFLVFIVYHSLARLTAISIVFTEQYAREDQDSKAKPIAKKSGKAEFILSFLFGLLPIFILIGITQNYFLLVILMVLILIRQLSIRYFNKWLQGYTGDCLGTVEQISEVLIILTIAASWKFI